MTADTLLLDLDYLPISMVPLSTVCWETAIKLQWLQKVSAVEYYDDWVVRSPSIAMRVPAVIVSKTKFKGKKKVKFSRTNLYLRDNWQCQYCGDIFEEKDLTIDHILPKSLGGKLTFENACTCCFACNKNKDNKLIKPIREPKIPSYTLLSRNYLDNRFELKHESWKNYIPGLQNANTG